MYYVYMRGHRTIILIPVHAHLITISLPPAYIYISTPMRSPHSFLFVSVQHEIIFFSENCFRLGCCAWGGVGGVVLVCSHVVVELIFLATPAFHCLVCSVFALRF